MKQNFKKQGLSGQTQLTIFPALTSELSEPAQNSSLFIATSQNPVSGNSQSAQQNKKSILQIHQLYNQIHNTINEMDAKVDHVIKKHEAQFLYAYRSHIKKIKKQLSQIKYKSEEQQKVFSSNDRIQYLEQELAIFRQQTMVIYNKLDRKNNQIDILKIKVKDLQKEVHHTHCQLKQNIKKNMISEATKINLQDQINLLQTQINLKNNQIQALTLKLKDHENQSKKSQFEFFSRNGSKTLTCNKKKNNLSPKGSENPIASGNSSINGASTNFWNTRKAQISFPRVYQTDLKSWFLQCIKTVKKQIAQRNNQQKSLQLHNIASIDEFLMIDKLRLLEIFLENQKLLTYMYDRIFPDRLSNLRDKLASKPFSISKNQPQQFYLEIQQQQRISSFNQQPINDSNRYNLLTKTDRLPKVLSLFADRKPKLSGKSQWKGSVILKDGKLNISMN